MSVKTLILMQGIPGSGKSTMVEALQHRFGFANTDVYSTDDYWYDAAGNYNFDPSLLGVAHQQNQDRVADAMTRGVRTIIVDNTNVKRGHVVPYVEAAREHGYDVQVVRVVVDPAIAAARNAERPLDRQVPAATINRMHREMEDLL